MKRPFVYRDSNGGLAVTMTPMIDVVFLLLVFFVCTVRHQEVEDLLPSNLTAVAGQGDPMDIDPEEAEFEPVIIRVLVSDGQPLWLVNDTPRDSLKQVDEMLRVLAEIKGDAPVILDPDPGVPLGDVIDLYDLARLAGFARIQFAASEEV
jgi:biopolymer transport protein ExbD